MCGPLIARRPPVGGKAAEDLGGSAMSVRMRNKVLAVAGLLLSAAAGALVPHLESATADEYVVVSR